ncbi:LPXTG cell wall anchor domain-containing protein, partial [Streptococcus pneumoniae]|uniref:LPXTG cell wall anchor domain-containing protein n=2 Tax=Streptococcus pneumoniae TaxID=1313 RepID=UPI000A7E64CD
AAEEAKQKAAEEAKQKAAEEAKQKVAEEAKQKVAEEAKQKVAFAGTSLDNTYKAPAAKKGLPSTGAKDNVALASLGFLGLFLGALPFVKHKN